MFYILYKIPGKNVSKIDKIIKDKHLETYEKNLNMEDFSATLYLSRNQQGNIVPWWTSYNKFVPEDTKPIHNLYNCGLLLIKPKNHSNYNYAITLGKSSLFIKAIIEKDFGINFALRMANENTVLLKKSTYHSGIKKGDMSHYIEFQKGNYQPGESVDYLKLKAKNADEWGQHYIECSDSIKINYDINPEKIHYLLKKIEDAYTKDLLINIPKTDIVTDEQKKLELYSALTQAIERNDKNIFLTQFHEHEGSITSGDVGNNFRIGAKKGMQKNLRNIVELEDTIEIADVFSFINKNKEKYDIKDIFIEYNIDDDKKEKTQILDIINFSIILEEKFYIFKNSIWEAFNETFMDHIRDSVNSIECEIREELDDRHLKQFLQNNPPQNKKLKYREYTFNRKMAEKYRYKVLDRENAEVRNINLKGKRYQLEIADLYDEKNEEVISVKIGDDNPNLIYNVKQSLGAVKLLLNGSITRKGNNKDNNIKVRTASLWFVLKHKIRKITELDKILLILETEEWKQYMDTRGIKTKIYITHHVHKENFEELLKKP